MANGFHAGEEGAAGAPARSSAKTLKQQIVEVHRLVDDAMANLEQVLRALQFLEKDL
jgi:hypothetical protein